MQILDSQVKVKCSPSRAGSYSKDTVYVSCDIVEATGKFPGITEQLYSIYNYEDNLLIL